MNHNGFIRGYIVISTIMGFTVFPMPAITEPMNTGYTVTARSSMEKFRQDETLKEKPVTDIDLFAARGEGESVQLVLSADREIKNVIITASPLVGPKNRKIQPEIRITGYVPIKKPTPGGFGIAGMYPDPLMPLRSFDVNNGESQSIWVTVWVPRDVPAGMYVGTVDIAPLGEPRVRLNVRLKVFGVTLPVVSALKTCFLNWNYEAKPEWYGAQWNDDRAQQLKDACLKYRFTIPPSLPWDRVFHKPVDGPWTAEWAEFDRTVKLAIERGVTAFGVSGIVPFNSGVPSGDEQENMGAKLQLLDEHLQKRRWGDLFYFYIFDESPVSDVSKLAEICGFVHKYGPHLNIISTAYHPEFRVLAGQINIWVPFIAQFDQEFMHFRQLQGDQIWMYVSISTIGTSYPDNWRIDLTGTAHRALGWWLWRHNCQGFLYWAVDCWPKDIFRNPCMDGGNGDGYLFYPDPEKKLDPFPSIRLEVQRDGFEDYDLLCMLRSAIARAKTDGKQSKDIISAELLLNADDVIVKPDQYVRDPLVYENRHRSVLEVLSQLSNK